MHHVVTAVIVSYNRAALLAQTLDALGNQSVSLQHIIVVDNASSDDAVKVACQHDTHPEVVQLQHNTGGAGGFCAGVALAASAERASEFIWLMDDDVIPHRDALQQLLQAHDQATMINHEPPAVLASCALWRDGREHPMNRPRRRTFIQRGAALLPPVKGASNATQRAFQVRSLSFVSCLIRTDAIRASRHLPDAAYFMWNDDFAYTTRLLKTRTGYYVPASQVDHLTKVFGSSDADPGARFYYEVRNKLWMLRYAPEIFAKWERLEFIAKAVRRWGLVMLRSKHKAQAWRHLCHGFHDAFSTRPQPNRDIFASYPAIVRAIAAIEDGDAF